jgi:hypothetical protein
MLIAAGIGIVPDAVRAAEAFDHPHLERSGWPFFRAPDGAIHVLQQDRAPSTPEDRGDA